MTSVSVVRHMDYHKQLKMLIILLIANSKTVKSICRKQNSTIKCVEK